jgi:hypothetical protein
MHVDHEVLAAAALGEGGRPDTEAGGQNEQEGHGPPHEPTVLHPGAAV